MGLRVSTGSAWHTACYVIAVKLKVEIVDSVFFYGTIGCICFTVACVLLMTLM